MCSAAIARGGRSSSLVSVNCSTSKLKEDFGCGKTLSSDDICARGPPPFSRYYLSHGSHGGKCSSQSSAAFVHPLQAGSLVAVCYVLTAVSHAFPAASFVADMIRGLWIFVLILLAPRNTTALLCLLVQFECARAFQKMQVRKCSFLIRTGVPENAGAKMQFFRGGISSCLKGWCSEEVPRCVDGETGLDVFTRLFTRLFRSHVCSYSRSISSARNGGSLVMRNGSNDIRISERG